jgi:hypothetical protein
LLSRVEKLEMSRQEFNGRVEEEVDEQLKSENTLGGVRHVPKEERLSMAVIFLKDAQARRDITAVNWQSAAARKAYRMHKHFLFSLAIRATIVLYAIISFWEPLNGLGYHLTAHTYDTTMLLVTTLEGLCVVMLCLDLYLRLTFTGLRNWFIDSTQRTPNLCLALLVVLSTLDFFLSLIPVSESSSVMCPRYSWPLSTNLAS